MMFLNIGQILFLLSVAVSASGSPGSFCSTGMKGSEDKPFIISKYVSAYFDNADKYFRDNQHIFQDCIERDHGYDRSNASCYLYTDSDTAVEERGKWVVFWEQKGREVITFED